MKDKVKVRVEMGNEVEEKEADIAIIGIFDGYDFDFIGMGRYPTPFEGVFFVSYMVKRLANILESWEKKWNEEGR